MKEKGQENILLCICCFRVCVLFDEKETEAAKHGSVCQISVVSPSNKQKKNSVVSLSVWHGQLDMVGFRVNFGYMFGWCLA